MKNRFRLFLILITVGGGLNTAEAQPLPIRVGYTILGSVTTPLWMAKELDLFERHGIQSSPIYMAATVAFQAMLAGDTDITIGGSILPVQAHLGGADPLIILTYVSGFGFSVMTRPTIQHPSDLNGKRIGVSRFGTPTDFGARIALKRWGLVPVKDVAIIQLGGDHERFTALMAGSVEAAVLGPPFSTDAKRQGMVELLDFKQSDVEFNALGLNSTARYVSAHGEATRRLVRALVEGIWAFEANREAALSAMKKYSHVTDRNLLGEAYESTRKIFRTSSAHN